MDRKKLYDYFWFDVPLIFDKTEDGYNFMLALQRTKNVDIFAHKGIQLIVENQWAKWTSYNKLMIMYPMVL